MSSDHPPLPKKSDSPRVRASESNKGSFVSDPQFESLVASEEFIKAPIDIQNVESEYDQLFSGNDNLQSPRFQETSDPINTSFGHQEETKPEVNTADPFEKA